MSTPEAQVGFVDFTRPCYHEEERAIFHRWITVAYPVGASAMIGGYDAGQIVTTKALIEYEDGTVRMVEPDEIRFADGGSFGDKIWFPCGEEGGRW